MSATSSSCSKACDSVDTILDYCEASYEETIDCVCSASSSGTSALSLFEGCTVCQNDAYGEHSIDIYEAFAVVCDTYQKSGSAAAQSKADDYYLSQLDTQYSTSLLPQIDSQFSVNPATQSLVYASGYGGYYTDSYYYGGTSTSTAHTSAPTKQTSALTAHSTSTTAASVRSGAQSITTTVTVQATPQTSMSSSSSAGAVRAMQMGTTMIVHHNEKLGLLFGITAVLVAAAAYAL